MYTVRGWRAVAAGWLPEVEGKRSEAAYCILPGQKQSSPTRSESLIERAPRNCGQGAMALVVSMVEGNVHCPENQQASALTCHEH